MYTRSKKEKLPRNARSAFNVRRLLAGRLKLIVINLLLLCIFMEVGSVVVYFVRTGKLFYARNRNSDDWNKELGLNLDGRLNNSHQELHPYFGFVDKPSLYISQIQQTTNNYGFPISKNYPLEKTNRNQFFVGIFGGSVAQIFCFNEFEDHTLASALKQIPGLRDKEIVILPFAVGSYKQPQQLLILDYFLSIGQQLDMVVNIDGLNDAAISYWNNKHGLEIYMPASYLVVPLVDLANKDLSSDELSLTLELLQSKDRLRNSVARLRSCHTATCDTLSWLYLQYLSHQYSQKLARFNSLSRGQSEDSIVYLNRVKDPVEDSEVLEKIVNNWADSSLMIREQLSARNILYFHIVQPNQYYPTRKQFSEEEKRTAINEQSEFKESVSKLYPRFLSRIDFLRGHGVNVFSAVRVFDDVKGPVYLDNCCHYNKVGNQVLAAFVSQTIVGALNKEKTFSSPQ